jgi:hypothetical protein
VGRPDRLVQVGEFVIPEKWKPKARRVYYAGSGLKPAGDHQEQHQDLGVSPGLRAGSGLKPQALSHRAQPAVEFLPASGRERIETLGLLDRIPRQPVSPGLRAGSGLKLPFVDLSPQSVT